jgi:hypothetical protein
MAEQEVIKHTKKVYKTLSSKEHSVWYKIKEFLIEILIIVFAVTLSIWLHDRSEHSHQQKEVKEFLSGLKEDLTSDIKEMEEDKKSYLKSASAFNYITHIKLNEVLNKDSLQKHQKWVLNSTGLVPNNGRFEGFKSSGKIGTIENTVLQNDIMDLYQENIPTLLNTTGIYTLHKQKFHDYLNKYMKKETDSTTNISSVLAADEAQNMSKSLNNVDEILSRYNICITKMNKIITAIDK